MSDNINTDSIILVGAGKMAIEYAKVLRTLNLPFTVIGRGNNSAKNFRLKTGVTVHTGGIEPWFNNNDEIPKTAIVAINVEEIAEITITLLKKGIKRILVEKPGGLNIEEIKEVMDTTKDNNSDVFIAYNRRFYASTKKAKQIIEDDGGVTSFHFEFTEWSHIIEKNYNINPEVKKQWFFANSSHVADMAFFLGGKPKNISCYTAGGLNWHPSSSIFSGAGVTDKGALFSYHANWEAPGRWGVELLTRKHRLILSPLEELYQQKLGSVSIEKVDLDDILDKNYKPGLYQQVKAFTTNINAQSLISIEEMFQYSAEIYSKIAYLKARNDHFVR